MIVISAIFLQLCAITMARDTIWGLCIIETIIAELSTGHSPCLESESRNFGLKMIHRTNQKLSFRLTSISHKTLDRQIKTKTKYAIE